MSRKRYTPPKKRTDRKKARAVRRVQLDYAMSYRPADRGNARKWRLGVFAALVVFWLVVAWLARC